MLACTVSCQIPIVSAYDADLTLYVNMPQVYHVPLVHPGDLYAYSSFSVPDQHVSPWNIPLLLLPLKYSTPAVQDLFQSMARPPNSFFHTNKNM